jgi:hypothetical protein
MSFRWIYASPENEESIEALSQELNIPKNIAYVPVLRVYTTRF